MDLRGPERSPQRVLQSLITIDKTLQIAYRISEQLVDLEDSMENMPLTIMLQNVANTRMSSVIASLELEKFQCLLRLRHEFHMHRSIYGRMPAIGLR